MKRFAKKPVDSPEYLAYCQDFLAKEEAEFTKLQAQLLKTQKYIKFSVLGLVGLVPITVCCLVFLFVLTGIPVVVAVLLVATIVTAKDECAEFEAEMESHYSLSCDERLASFAMSYERWQVYEKERKEQAKTKAEYQEVCQAISVHSLASAPA